MATVGDPKDHAASAIGSAEIDVRSWQPLEDGSRGEEVPGGRAGGRGPAVNEPGGPASNDAAAPLGLVSPFKAVRVLAGLQRTIDEVRHMALDEAARRRLVDLHRATLIELASSVSDVLIDELVRLHAAPLAPDATAAQIRIAQAQLLGWAMGLVQSGGGVDGAPLPAGMRDARRLAAALSLPVIEVQGGPGMPGGTKVVS